MKKPVRASAVRKSTAKKTTGANPQSSLSRRTTADWRDALERNLRAEGYSADEARELVEIAAS
jgi:hypothetical protein